MIERFAALTAGAYQDRRELEWVYVNHLLQHRPQRIVEIGVAKGGTTRLFLDLVGPNGLVVGLDVSSDNIAPDVLRHPNFKLLLGSSYAPEMVTRVKALMPECDLLLIDGDHTEAGVLADTECYVPMVREGGLVLWHDVRLESPAGIKGIWYRRLRKQFVGATEYFTDPFNTGFGIWYKRAGRRSSSSDGPDESRAPEDEVEKAAAELVDVRRRLADAPRDPGLRLELYEATERDPASLRAEVIEALVAAVDATRGRPEWKAQYDDLVRRSIPKLGAQLARLQKWGEVPAFVEKLLELDPDISPQGLECLSEGLYWASQRVRDLSAVMNDYRRVYERCLHHAGDQVEGVRVRLARTLRYERLYPVAEEFCRSSLEVAPDHFEMRKEHAGALLDAGKIEEVHLLLRELHQQRPDDVDVRYYLVATAREPDVLVTTLHEEVVSLARKGRQAIAMNREGAPAVLDQLQRLGFVFLKGVVEPAALSDLDVWAQKRCLTENRGPDDRRLGPEQRRVLIEQMERSGLRWVIDEYLGDWFMHQDSFLKELGASAGYLAWHQDGRTSNSPFRYGTFWMALDACGIERPGLEIVSYPFRGFCAAGPPKAPRAGYLWSMNEDLIIAETRWAPVFEPGDMLIFHKFVAHGTQIVPDPNRSRRSFDFRLHSRTRQD